MNIPLLKAQVFERRDVERIHHRHHQGGTALDLERQRPVLLGEFFLELRQRLFVGDGVVQIDQRHSELALEGLEQLLFRDQAHLDHGRAEELAGAALLVDGRLETLGRYELALDQEVTQAFVFLWHGVSPIHG
jgi:hypothetical protein